MLKVEKFVFNDFNENTYLIWDEDSKEAIVVDPGCITKSEQIQFSEFVEKENLTLKYLVSTHCHLDHVFGNAFIKNRFSPEYLINEKESSLLDMLVEHAHKYGFEVEQSPLPDRFIDERTILKLGENSIKILFTPGHSPGEICLLLEKEKICITGDVLFKEGIGRTDLWGGDYFTLMDSIQDILFKLPEETIILPGHGDSSTIEHEKNNNPFF